MRFVILIYFVFCTCAAWADQTNMIVGKDTFVFDVTPDALFGKSILVYTLRGEEPGSDIAEGVSHQLFKVEDIEEAVPELSKANFTIGIAIMNNAYAVIHGNERYVVVDPNWLQSDPARLLVIAHEIGHHICGHTSGILSDRPWDKELEADTFAGFVVRRLEEKSQVINLNIALSWANALLDPNSSPTHPPSSMRIQAITNGYYNGSPCLGRDFADVAGTGIHSGANTSSGDQLWNHNGSIVRLVAEGSNRSFIYELPREGLAALGVNKGTLLFKGKRVKDNYVGTAYVFSHCGPTGYAVSGPVSTDQRSVVLKGDAPITGTGCKVSRFRKDTLVFKFQGH